MSLGRYKEASKISLLIANEDQQQGELIASVLIVRQLPTSPRFTFGMLQTVASSKHEDSSRFGPHAHDAS
jgi:hypothetical protein